MNLKKYIKVRKHPGGEEVEEEYNSDDGSLPEGWSSTIIREFTVDAADVAEVWDGDNTRGDVLLFTPEEGMTVLRVAVYLDTFFERNTDGDTYYLSTVSEGGAYMGGMAWTLDGGVSDVTETDGWSLPAGTAFEGDEGLTSGETGLPVKAGVGAGNVIARIATNSADSGNPPESGSLRIIIEASVLA